MVGVFIHCPAARPVCFPLPHLLGSQTLTTSQTQPYHQTCAACELGMAPALNSEEPYDKKTQCESQISVSTNKVLLAHGPSVHLPSGAVLVLKGPKWAFETETSVACSTQNVRCTAPHTKCVLSPGLTPTKTKASIFLGPVSSVTFPWFPESR